MFRKASCLAMVLLVGCLGSPTLYEAAYRGDTTQVKALLMSGEDPDEPATRGWTSLGIAAAEGHVTTVRALLDGGADPNQANMPGRTPLMYAARYGFDPIVELLLDVVSGMCLAVGSVFALIGGIGLLRLPDFFCRIHGGGITDTMGAGLVLLGLMLHTWTGFPGADVHFQFLVTVKLLMIDRKSVV